MAGPAILKLQFLGLRTLLPVTVVEDDSVQCTRKCVKFPLIIFVLFNLFWNFLLNRGVFFCVRFF